MKFNKVIFLDIDGVLWPYDSSYPKDEYGYTFKKESIEALKLLLAQSGSDVVISSTWKTMGLSLLKEMWEMRKLPGRLVSITPEFQQEYIGSAEEIAPYKLSRGYEIEQWLKNNTVSKYLIVDDLNDFSPEQQRHLIVPKANEGLTRALAWEGIKILSD